MSPERRELFGLVCLHHPSIGNYSFATGYDNKALGPGSVAMGSYNEACFVHRSQNIEATYGDDHGKMEVFRGMESGCQYAEAYIRHIQSPAPFLQIH